MSLSPPLSDSEIADVTTSSLVRTFFRRVAVVLLSLLLIALLLASSGLRAANALVGTSRDAANSFLSLVTAEGVSSAIAHAALTDVGRHSSPSVAQHIAAHERVLTSTIVRTINDPAVQKLISRDVQLAYDEVRSGTGGVVDVAPLVAMFTRQLHAVDPSIPATPPTFHANYVLTIQPRPPLTFLRSLAAASWFLSTLAVVGAVLVARFLVRGRTLQLVLVALIVGFPGVALTLVGARSGVFSQPRHVADGTGRVVTQQIFDRLGATLAAQGELLVVAALGIILLWLGLRLVRREPSAAMTVTT